MTDVFTFDQIVQSLRPCPHAVRTGQRLVYPDQVRPFVPPTVGAREGAFKPLTSDILFFTAPAAVGKSTFARSMAARAHVPLLNLATVRVATDALGGAVSAEMGAVAQEELQQGAFSLIVDALDEGKILSGEGNWEAFLRTSFEFLLQNPSPRGHGPKLLFFGRPDAIEWAKIILEDVSSAITASQLTINYFDENAAVELVLECSRAASGSDLKNQESKIREVIDAYFDAISAALNIPRAQLWRDHHGQSFTGYAPVLAALGTLVGKARNYEKALQLLRVTEGQADAWDILENVTWKILDREADEKVRDKLRANHGDRIPPEAYDAADQLHHIANHLAGSQFGFSSRLPFTKFGSPEAQNDYKKAVEAHLNEHPFLREGKPANDVLGALVLAEAIANGRDTLKGQGGGLLAVYGRQPFLWRFIRRRFSVHGLIASPMVPYVLSSLWSDDMMANAVVSVRCVQGAEGKARLIIAQANEAAEVGSRLPLVLLWKVRDLDVLLPADQVLLRGWPGPGTSAIEFTGNTRIQAQTLAFEVENIYVGTPKEPAKCYLQADDASGDQQLAPPEVRKGSRLTVKGVFENRYPWGAATVDRTPPVHDPIWQFLVDCSEKLPVGVPPVVMTNYDLPDATNLDWAKKHGDLLPKLLRALVAAGLAKGENIGTKGDPKMLVRPNIKWGQLREAYEDPDQMDPKMRKVFEGLK